MICIACPRSKNGKTRRLWPYWQRRLAEAGIDASWINTERPGHATEIAYKMAQTNAENHITEPIVAVGGDGTINEVLSGLLAAKTEAPMGVLYAGTSPDFCRFHQIPTDPREAIEVLLAGETKKIDTVRVRHLDATGGEQEAYFACSCNVGLGAAVARFSNRYRKFLGDFPGTLAGVLQAFCFSRPIDLIVEVDGEEYRCPRCNHLMLVKNPYIASGLCLDLPLKVDDGQAYILAVHDQGRFGLCRQLPKFYTGRVAKSDAIFLKPFRKVTVRSFYPDEKIEVEYDGDPHGFLPLEAELIPQNLKLIGTNDARE